MGGHDLPRRQLQRNEPDGFLGQTVVFDMNNRISVAAWASAAVLTSSSASSAPAAMAAWVQTDAIYCVVQDGRNRSVYYSTVFRGEYLNAADYQRSFIAYVDARYGETAPGSLSLCFYEDTIQEALEARYVKAATDRRDRYEVIWTRWKA